MELNRFDVPDSVKAILEKSVEIGMIDASDLVTLGATHLNDWTGLVIDIIEIAHSNRHWNYDHEIIAPLVNEFYKETDDAS
jgi:hypothetical protein